MIVSLAIAPKRMQYWRFYFLPRFCGARCDSADAATLRTDLLLIGDLSTFDATFATFALVLRPVAILIPSLLVIFYYPPHNLITFFVSGDSPSRRYLISSYH